MHVSRYLASSLMSLTTLSSAGLVEAGPVSVTFSGELGPTLGPRTGALTALMPGDAFTGSFQVDFYRAFVSVLGDDTLFGNAILDDSRNLQVGNLTFTSAPGAIGSFGFRDSARGDFLSFAFQFALASGSPELFQVEFLFEDFFGSYFNAFGTLLPEDLSNFDRTTLRIFPFDPSTATFGEPVIGTIRSASVPEPGEAASLILGLVALALLRLRSARAESVLH